MNALIVDYQCSYFYSTVKKKQKIFDYTILNQSFFFTECSFGTYGQGCIHTCGNCRNGDRCNHVNGSCPNGCGAGVFGDKCDQRKKKKIIERFFIQDFVFIQNK